MMSRTSWAILILMTLTGLDFFFHLVELFSGIRIPSFPSRVFYTSFWTLYWGLGFILSLYLWIKLRKLLEAANML